MATNFLATLNGQQIDLGIQLQNQSSQTIMIPTAYPTNQEYSISFKRRVLIKTNDIKAVMNGYCQTGSQTYTFGPAQQGLWVGAGNNINIVAFSNDGINWYGVSSAASAIFGTSGRIYGFAYNGKVWVTVGSGTSTLAYSFDGKIWYTKTVFSTAGYVVVWNGTMFVAGGKGTAAFAYSYDGINWTNSASFTSITIRSLAWNGSIWLAGEEAATAYIYSSTDGINWTITSRSFSTYVSSIAWNGSFWLASGDGASAYSSDGTTWFSGSVNSVISSYINFARWDGSKWLAGGFGSGNSIAYTSDPRGNVGWIGSRRGGPSNLMYNMYWNGKLFVGGGITNTNHIYSIDGLNWGLARNTVPPDTPDTNIPPFTGTPDINTTLSGYYILGFTSTGSKQITITQPTTIYYLVVAGGGAGGRDNGGGGGAGGVLQGSISLATSDTITVTVGAGGIATNQYGIAASGGSSSIIFTTNTANNKTAIGGGGGGGAYSGGGNGGSGGGTGYEWRGNEASRIGLGTAGQGNNGGYNGVNGGGGGGAGSAGSGSVGGNGVQANQPGISAYYPTQYWGGGGGGGTGSSVGTGGLGGGGGGTTFAAGGGSALNSGTAGSTNTGGNGGANTGGGGGGGGGVQVNQGGNGGSGIVVLAMPIANTQINTLTPSSVIGLTETITTVSTNKVHSFTLSGSSNGTCNVTFNNNMNIQVLVVAGGGGGGCGGGAGGGAGGVIYNASFPVTAGTPYSIRVGAGGAGSTSNRVVGSCGNNSVFSTLNAIGGGGASSDPAAFGTYFNGFSSFIGGSGGGGVRYAYGNQIGRNGTPGQGNKGGNYSSNESSPGQGNGSYYCNGGGGGAGAAGGNGSSSGGGAGGIGISNSITGTATLYGGGGGGFSSVGSTYPIAAGGLGGGGASSGLNSGGISGTANTGGGGGGGALFGGNGGSGIVIISYPLIIPVTRTNTVITTSSVSDLTVTISTTPINTLYYFALSGSNNGTCRVSFNNPAVVQVLVVAGGGGGGVGDAAGGGGGGGVIYNPSFQVNAATNYNIQVGAGGTKAVSTSSKGVNGSDSIFSTLTAIGGGGGASNHPSIVVAPGTGGSGGGASYNNTSTSTNTLIGGSGTTNQGLRGGYYRLGSGGGGGGGGGAVGTSGYLNPLDTPNCLLWLDAADTSSIVSSSNNVSQWNDKSGNGYNFVNGALTPVLSNNGITFISTSGGGGANTPTLRNTTIPLGTSYTIFVVAIQNSNRYSSTGYNYVMKFGAATDWFLFFGAGPNGHFATFAGSASSWNDLNVNTPNQTISNRSLLVATNDNITNELIPYYNGTAMNTKIGITESATGLIIGDAIAGQTNQCWNGTIYEILIYNRALSTLERQQIEGYLAIKWQIQYYLPLSHPYSNASVNPNILGNNFNPLNTPNCLLWLDTADSSSIVYSSSNNVSQWNDKSGNGYNFVNGALTPIFSNNGITFTSSSGTQGANTPTLKNTTIPFGTSYTIFAVAVQNLSHYSYTNYNYILKGSTDNAYFLFFGTHPTGNFATFTGSSTTFNDQNANAPNQHVLNRSLLCVTNDNTSTGLIPYYNGTAMTAKNGSTVSFTGLTIGDAIPAFSNQSWNGTIYEILIYNRVLTTSERQQIEGYLANKWSLQDYLPASHPYKVGIGGNGGAGIVNYITGIATSYAGGGGGGSGNGPTGGTGGGGGGGNGGNNVSGSQNGGNATPNTGGGGGGSGFGTVDDNTGRGGSGMVIISIPLFKTVSSSPTNSVTTSSVSGLTVTTTTTPMNTISSFRLSGSSNGTCSVSFNNDTAVQVLVVAGGGGGGADNAGGGGGGGVIYYPYFPVIAGTTYNIQVGAGGTKGVVGTRGVNGSNSIFSTLTAIGGGGGANNHLVVDAGNGGSGGGASYNNTVTSSNIIKYGGSGTIGQGFRGGDFTLINNLGGGGGGGGAGGVGSDGSRTGTVNIGGNGGPGILNSITGTPTYYGGGGGGGTWNGPTAGTGGIGGGGNGGIGNVNGVVPSDAAAAGANATPHTGGGGGGSGWGSGIANTGAGGSGIVIISTPLTNSTISPPLNTLTTSSVSNLTVSSPGYIEANTVYSFTLSSTTNGTCNVTFNNTMIIQVLVVAGGGGGGMDTGGGGGGGGVIYSSYFPVTADISYAIQVGAGGVATSIASTPAVLATNGNDSIFGNLIAIGGGRGAGYQPSPGSGANNGGSGGGANNYSTKTPGSGTTGQGNSGGNVSSGGTAAGGGGGAGGVGGNGVGGATGASTDVGGAGGIGMLISITGAPTYYGGGGGGGTWSGDNNSSGGLGGGGSGGGRGISGSTNGATTVADGIDGLPNTGGGGGGNGFGNASRRAGKGGSGIVIISFPTYQPPISNAFAYNNVTPHSVTFPRYTVVAGSNGTTDLIQYSYNGTTWVSSLNVATGIFASVTEIAYNGTIWLAGGTPGNSTIAYSYNGINWSGLGNSIFQTAGVYFVWNGTMWIATGVSTTTGWNIAYSYDGLLWVGAVRNDSFFSNGSSSAGARGVAWNGRMFVCVGTGTTASNCIIYSYNGINWFSTGQTIFTTTGNDVVWIGSLWIAVGQGTNSIAYSYDGLIWTGLGTSITSQANNIAWNGKMAILTHANGIATSFDGITWASNTSVFSNGAARGIAWDGTRWQLGSTTATSAFSYNGFNWTTYTASSGRTQTNSFASTFKSTPTPYIQHPSVAVGAGQNTLAYSDDGITWTGLGSTIFSNEGHFVLWNGQIWVAVGSGNNTIAYSIDGINWTGLGSTIFSVAGNGLVWNGSIWVATGNDPSTTIAYSTNGINWVSLGNGIFSVQGLGIAWNGYSFVALGEGTNSIAYSSNGMDWTGIGTSTFTTTGYDIATNGVYWIATGSGDTTLAYTTDLSGSNGWTSVPGIFGTAGKGICWNGSTWVAVGEGGNSIAYSTNATSWTGAPSSTNTFTTTGLGCCWNGVRFIATGQGGNSIAYSQNGINWYPGYNGLSNTSTTQVFTLRGNNVSSNPRVGIPIVESQMVLNSSGPSGISTLQVNAPPYYQNGFNEVSFKVEQSNAYS